MTPKSSRTISSTSRASAFTGNANAQHFAALHVDPRVVIYKRIPNAEMHIFDQANHFVWMDPPQKFCSLVSWFLSRDC